MSLSLINNWITTLTAAITASDTVLPIAASMLDKLEMAEGKEYRLTLASTDSPLEQTVEIIRFYHNGTTSLMERGAEGTTALAWPSGSLVYAGLTAGVIASLGPGDWVELEMANASWISLNGPLKARINGDSIEFSGMIGKVEPANTDDDSNLVFVLPEGLRLVAPLDDPDYRTSYSIMLQGRYSWQSESTLATLSIESGNFECSGSYDRYYYLDGLRFPLHT